MKPNIRGIARSQMSLGLFGWTARVSGQNRFLLVEYRMPFRKNWLIRMTRDPQATIMQSRSGFIHIVRPQTVHSIDKTRTANRFNPKIAAVAGLAVVITILFVGTLSQIPRQRGDSQMQDSQMQDSQMKESQMNDSQLDMKVLDSPAPCSDDEVMSISNVQNALSGLPSKLKILDRSASVQLGGYRLTSITVDCQSQRFRLKVTEAKVKSTWKLKKTARLEN